LHTGQAEVEAGWTYQMLYIEPDTLRKLTGTEAFFPEAATHDPLLAQAYRHAFARMWDAPDDLAFVSDFTRLIDAIVQRYGRNARREAAPARNQRSRPAMQRVLDRIEAGLDGDLRIEHLANEAGLSLFHFVRVFTAAFHATPHQYVQARRAVRAKALLSKRMTPSEAAAAAGLTDQSHLNRWFKRAYGVTPAQYQQQVGSRPDATRQR